MSVKPDPRDIGLPYRDNPGQTHHFGCYRLPKHHNCAINELNRIKRILGYYERNEIAGRDKVARAAAMEQAIRMVIDWFEMNSVSFVEKYGGASAKKLTNALRTVLGEP